MPMPAENSVKDCFCGAGGSSTGAEMGGGEVVFALNHSALAINVHNTNHPKTDHLLIDVQSMTDGQIRRTPDSALLIAGAECTNHTLAKGARSRKEQAEPLFDEDGVPTDSGNGAPLADGVEERSRATMDEVCRFAEQKALKGRPYLAIVLENVSESHSWGQNNDGRYFKKWLNRILKVGYEHEILWLNSMLLPPEPGIPLVPQSRDRMYVVFWKRGIRRPDLSVKPPCWCVRCEKVVAGLQVFKKPEKPTRVAYGPQYYYVCPECHATAVPAAAPAASIIDYTVPITRIGERERPLKPATRERIKRGLRRLATDPFAIRLKQGREPAPLTIPLIAGSGPATPTITFPVSGTTYETTPGNRAKDAASTPLPTVAATGERGMVMANHQHAVPKDAASHAAQTVRTEGGLSLVTRTGHKSANGTLARDASADPTLGITSAGDLALVLANRIHGVPKDAHTHPAQTVCTGETLGVVELQQNGGVRRSSAPAHTVRGGGGHHGLLVSNYSPGWTRAAAELPFGSVTTTDGHALVVPYSTKGKSSVAGREATPTVTTVERLSLVVPRQLPFGTVLPDPGPIGEDQIDACFFRMFTVAELARAMAMAFRADGSPFVLEGTRASRIKLLGNAINPPVMRLIISRLLAAIDSTPAGGMPDAA